MQFEIQNLSVGYEHPIIENVSFGANPGEIIGILGRNGCGKTTLLRGITGTNKRFSGEILINGQNCTHLSAKKMAAHLSILPQRTDIMSGIRVKEVLEMGLYPHGNIFHDVRKKEQERILSAARTLGITDLLDMDCEKLSQGQRQLVLLARVIIQDAPVLLLDEPDAALDFYNTHVLFSTLHDLIKSSGKTAVMVLHDPEQALRWCDRLLILNDKTIVRELEASADDDTLQDAFGILYPEIQIKRETRISFCL